MSTVLILSALQHKHKNASLFVQLHGTGTPLGDPIEMSAAAVVLASGARLSTSNALALASSKSIVGHAEPAAGAPIYAAYSPAVNGL